MMPSRFACTMWEFSWLVRRSGKEAEYANWDRVLDELAERGYNCIRIDAFPHLVAADALGARVDEFTILPQPGYFMWGNHEAVQANPRAGLVEFIGKAKQRGIYIGLSSWFNDDTLHRRAEVRTPADYARIWMETLDLLDGASLLDRIVWVDLCNEFPLPIWSAGAFEAIFGALPQDLAGIGAIMNGEWSSHSLQTMQRYFDDSIAPLHAKYPDLKYTFSLVGIGAAQVQNLDVSAFGVAEPHIWLTDDAQWMMESGQVLALTGAPDAVRIHAEKMRDLYAPNRDAYFRILEARLDFWAAWARAKNLPLFTTEAWGPVNYDDVTPNGDGGEWHWVKDICAEGVRLAVEKGWTGICTSNFCQPHFEGMWADVAWHKEMTQLIRAGA